MTARTLLKRKEVDDVLGGEDMWKHADKTQGMLFTQSVERCDSSHEAASCDSCNFNEAYFYQLQIRSADEPMTTCVFSPPPLPYLVQAAKINANFHAQFTGEYTSGSTWYTLSSHMRI